MQLQELADDLNLWEIVETHQSAREGIWKDEADILSYIAGFVIVFIYRSYDDDEIKALAAASRDAEHFMNLCRWSKPRERICEDEEDDDMILAN